MAGFDLRQVEHLVDQPCEALRFGDDDSKKAAALFQLDPGVVTQHLGECPDRGERRAQLMGHRGHEIVLQPVEFLQALVGGPQLAGGRFQRARLLLELVGVGTNLRRFVENVHYLVETERLRFDRRRHHHVRRRPADRAGQQRLGKMHQIGIRRQLLDLRDTPASRVGLERSDGSLGPQEACHQRQELPDPDPRTPEHRQRVGVAAHHVDIHGGLRSLTCAGRKDERKQQVATDVEEQAPEQCMADRV